MTQLGHVFREAAKSQQEQTAVFHNGCCHTISVICNRLDPSCSLEDEAKYFFYNLFGPPFDSSEDEPRATAYWMLTQSERCRRSTWQKVKERRILALLLAAEIADYEEIAKQNKLAAKSVCPFVGAA